MVLGLPWEGRSPVLTIVGIIIFGVIPALLVLEVLRCIYLEYRRDRMPILLYHRLVCKADADRGLVRDDEMVWASYDTRFAEQMEYLRQAGWTTLDFDDFLKIRAGEMPRPAKPVFITFDDGYVSNYIMGLPVFKRLRLKATIYVSPEPNEYTRKQVEGVDGFMTPQQLREMTEAGISIQSHTLTHCVLAELSDAEAMYELEESRRRLAEITGRSVLHLAIPRAGYSRRVKRLVRQAGYLTACCNNKGSANGLSDPLALPRIVIERDMTVAEFARSLEPRDALVLRIVGNIKRIPERLGGSGFARWVRRKLYFGPLGGLFRTRTLKKLIALAAVCYMAGAVVFFWYLLTT